MSFQWNQSRPSRQIADRTQPMPQWASQEQYNPGNIPTNQNQYAFQETGTSSNDWNPGVPYNQWCPSTSQEQMNWACTNYPTNQYNQMLQNNFASNMYSAYNQNKSNYGESFSGIYNESERNNSFDYQLTNSFLTTQGNSSYRMPQSNFFSNCQGPAKACSNPTSNSSFPYWDSTRNGNETMNYMPHSLYTNRVCDNISVPNMTMKRVEMEPNHSQDEMMRTYNKKTDLIQQSQVLKPNATNSRFSNSAPSDYFMGIMSHENVSSNMSPIQNDGKSQNFYNSFCSMNPPKEVDSSLEPPKYNNTNNPKGMFNFNNNPQNRLELTAMPKRDEHNNENLLQRRILNMEKRILEKSSEFEKMKNLSEETKYERSYGEMYNLNADIKSLESEMDTFESEMRITFMGHNVPSCIDLNEHGLSCNSKYGLPGSGKGEYELSSVKSLRHNLCKLRDQVLQQLNAETKPDLLPESGPVKTKRPEEQTDLAVAAKASPLKQVRRAVLKYLLRLSGRVEKCFSELRNVKKILKDDPNDKEVIKILQKVGMHINQSRLSLKEKKKLCAKNNIRLRSLTIKSTGTNILQTLESDMYHLRRFYTALNHIARHLGTIEKVPQESKGPDDVKKSSFQLPSYLDSVDDSSDIEDEANSPSSFQANSCPVSEGMSSMDQPTFKKSNIRDTSFTGPPQKSVRFMVSERRFWDKLMEVSYQIRSKILALRQAERAYKNGEKGSLVKVRSLSESPRRSLKKEVKLLIHWKKKYNFSRHIPTCILQSYPEQERRSRDKITLKSVRKTLATFMSLCYSTRVLIDSGTPCPANQNTDLKEEARFWKRLHILLQKIKMYHSELSKIHLTLMANRQDKKSLESLIRIEARVKEIESDIVKEEKNKQKNGYSDAMPTNVETQKLKVIGDELKNVHVMRESFQNLKSLLLNIKSSQIARMPNQELVSQELVSSRNTGGMSVQTHSLEKELPSDLAHFLGDGASGWI